MNNQETLADIMKQSIARIESGDSSLRRRGFEEITKLAIELPPDSPGEVGFFDYVLFSARKHANDESESVRAAIAALLCAISGRTQWWREGVLEVVEEIESQPASAPKQVADAARRQMERG